jgi:hypothetical protein
MEECRWHVAAQNGRADLQIGRKKLTEGSYLAAAGRSGASRNDGIAFLCAAEAAQGQPENIIARVVSSFATTKESNSVVAPCGLHSSLRQQGIGAEPDCFRPI